jgi:DNA-binding MarR family transcriptional regulator
MAAYFYVAENPGVSILEVALLTDTSISTASRALRALLPDTDFMTLPPSLGLIRMEPNPNDGRSRMVFLTEAGEALRGQINAKLAEAILIEASPDDTSAPLVT